MSMQKNLRHRFRLATFGLVMTLLPAQLDAGEKFTYTYKDYTGKVLGTKTIDTDIFWREDGQLWLTAETMTAIDVNNQKLEGTYTRAQITAERNPDERMTMLKKNLVLYTLHLADAHIDSVKKYVALQSKNKGYIAVEKLRNTDAYKNLPNDARKLEAEKRAYQEAVKKEYARQDRKYSTKYADEAKAYGGDWKKIPYPTSLYDINKLAKQALDLD